MTLNAALALEGRTLPNGWVVGPLRVPAADATGGVFSVSYPVSKENGTQGFLKVLNLGLAMQQTDVVGTLLWMTSQFSAERDLCVMCGEKRLSKIVTAIDHGALQFPEYAPLSSVSYIIFEMATHDVRRALSLHAEIDEVIRLEYLHSIAMGLRQLHGIKVAHQDVKPSNFLVFPDESDGRATGKLADLGRAFRSDQPNSLDSETIPGDRNYAPPEQLYGYLVPDEAGRRFGADLFQLGNMACFLFTGRTMNAMFGRVLDPKVHWKNYGDDYDTALPYLEEGYSRILSRLEERLTSTAGREIVPIIGYLCEPDYKKRGHPAARKQIHGSPYRLDRVITDLDLGARRAAVRVNR